MLSLFSATGHVTTWIHEYFGDGHEYMDLDIETRILCIWIGDIDMEY